MLWHKFSLQIFTQKIAERRISLPNFITVQNRIQWISRKMSENQTHRQQALVEALVSVSKDIAHVCCSRSAGLRLCGGVRNFNRQQHSACGNQAKMHVSHTLSVSFLWPDVNNTATATHCVQIYMNIYFK